MGSWLRANAFPCLSKGTSVVFVPRAADGRLHKRQSASQRVRNTSEAANPSEAAHAGASAALDLCRPPPRDACQRARAVLALTSVHERPREEDGRGGTCQPSACHLWWLHQPLSVSSSICETGTRVTPTPHTLAHVVAAAASREGRRGTQSPAGPGGRARGGTLWCPGARVLTLTEQLHRCYHAR